MHAVLGAGGVGGLIGGALARAGHQVTLLVRPEALVAHPRRLRVESRVLGEFEVTVDVDSGLHRPVDVLWVTVKAAQLETALAAAPPDRVEKALVVPLLNGVDHVGVLRERYGTGPVLPGAIRVESERVAPGHIVQAGPSLALDLGVRPESRAVAEGLARELGAAGLACQVTDGEATTLWRKLAVLAPMALTTTCIGAPIGAVRADPVWHGRLVGCAREAAAVGIAEGAEIDPERTVEQLLSTPDAMQTSMQKDAAAGRLLELDAIAGPILRLGRRHGIDVSITEALVALIEGGRT